MADIVKQMREAAEELDHTDPVQKLLRRAAAEFEHMRSQYIDRLEEVEHLRRRIPSPAEAPAGAGEVATALVAGARAEWLHGPYGYLICYGGAGHEDGWRLEDDPDTEVLSLPLFSLTAAPGLTAPSQEGASEGEEQDNPSSGCTPSSSPDPIREEMARALEAFVKACDSAPPTQLMAHLSRACEAARTALSLHCGGK